MGRRHVRPPRRRLRSGDRPGHQARGLRVRGRAGRRRRGREGRLPGLARDVALEAHRHHVQDPEPGRGAPPRAGRPPDRRARQGPVRRARRDRPRAREPRVRVRRPEPAQGRVQRAGLAAASTSTRSASRSASWPGSRRSTSRRWSRCGCSRRPSRPATRSSSSRPRRTRPRRTSWPSCSPRPASRTASSTSSTATRSRSTRSSPTRTSRRCRSSARRRSRATSTRPGTKAGKRVQALGGAKNHMIVLPDADIDMAADAAVSAGYGSAGERCMAIATIVAVGDVADPLVEAIKARLPKVKVGPGQRSRRPRWARWSPTASRQGRVVPRQRPGAGRDGRRRRPRASAVRRARTGSSWASR